MGLDGISINQLRITPENNSAELNNAAKFNTDMGHKIVDGLSQGQKVDPDREKEHENPELLEQFVKPDEDEQEGEQTEQIEEVIKYDLSENNKYYLNVDEETNKIMIIEKATKNVVQEINADKLSGFVGYLSNSQGTIVNRKF
ncbi:hypothetical protein IJX73_02415 [bacterium]|nr:hypothetical protein [bacterium]MBQ9149763.1 hypothetical protein [bacterium]